VVQFVTAFSWNISMAFLTLFIHSELGVSSLSEAVMWAGTAQLLSNLGLSVMSPVWGWLTDRIGGKKMLLRTMLGNATILILVSLSTSPYQVVALRLLEGIITGTGTIVMAIMASSVDANRLPQVIGYQQSIMTAGSLVGPAIGVAMVTAIGFRYCLFISGMIILAAVPLVLWARFEERRGSDGSHERIHWNNLKGLGRDFTALLSVQAAFGFVTPILPLYLSEAGLAGSALVQHTGIILTLSSLAYAASVPVTTRIFKRRAIPLLLAAASGTVFLQAFFRQAFSFTILRVGQCFLHSAAPSRLLGEAGEEQSNKGLTLGILNSARTIGNAIGPFLASSVAYMIDLTTAFLVISLLSILAAIATIPRRHRTSSIGRINMPA
jgi:MFS family permease